MTRSDTENLSTSILAKQGAGEASVSRRTWSAAWRGARESQMVPLPCDGGLVGKRLGGGQRHLLVKEQPTRCRLRSSSPFHSVLQPSPFLRALVQELEVLVPSPVPLIGFVQLKLSLSAHDMWVPSAEG